MISDTEALAVAALFCRPGEALLVREASHRRLRISIGDWQELCWDGEKQRVFFRALLYDCTRFPMPDLGVWPEQHRIPLEEMRITEDVAERRYYLEWELPWERWVSDVPARLADRTRRVLSELYFQLSVLDDLWIFGRGR